MLVVSIPLWFSLNSGKGNNFSVVFNVSIPLWFSLNPIKEVCYENEKCSFHPTMVLAQPLCSAFGAPIFSGFHTTMVLAQRDSGIIFTGTHEGFHPTMVLAQRGDLMASHKISYVFPSHYGSRSTWTPSYTYLFRLFPSHYGSRSTRSFSILTARKPVSIPLWFSLNACQVQCRGKCHRVSIPLWFSLNQENL